MLQDTTTIMIVSMVKDRGRIVNKNLIALSNFFEYLDVRGFK
jgi:hypothetical protein